MRRPARPLNGIVIRASKFGEHPFHAVTRYGAVCAAHPRGERTFQNSVKPKFAELPFQKLFGKSGGGAGQGSESSQEGSKEPRSVASCRQINPVERPSAIFQTVSLETVWKVAGRVGSRVCR